MSLANSAYLILVATAFTLFAVVLGGGAIYCSLGPSARPSRLKSGRTAADDEHEPVAFDDLPKAA